MTFANATVKTIDDLPIFDTIKFDGGSGWFLSFQEKPCSCWEFLKPNRDDPSLYDIRYFGFSSDENSIFYFHRKESFHKIRVNDVLGKANLEKQILDLFNQKFETFDFAGNNCSARVTDLINKSGSVLSRGGCKTPAP